jgi:hypothetical protein
VEAAIRPWRTATFVASAIAIAELVALVVAVLALVSGPLARGVKRHAAAQATAAATAAPAPKPVMRVVQPPPVARLPRARTNVLVLNGNGRQGAAGDEAISLQVLGYRVSATGNAPRSDYSASMVMFRPGYRPEALRLARDAGIRVVGPLDGLRVRDLKGSQLAVIVGT